MTIYDLFKKIARLLRCFPTSIIKMSFKSCGKHVSIGKRCDFVGIKNITVHSNVAIGDGCKFITTKAKVIINDYVMFAPDVTVVTGDHRVDIKGKPMFCVSDKEKKDENDRDVIFEGDNWIGTKSTILKGVTVGKGSVVAAGSVVTKNIPKNAIAAGNPAKIIKYRFEDEN